MGLYAACMLCMHFVCGYHFMQFTSQFSATMAPLSEDSTNQVDYSNLESTTIVDFNTQRLVRYIM